MGIFPSRNPHRCAALALAPKCWGIRSELPMPMLALAAPDAQLHLRRLRHRCRRALKLPAIERGRDPGRAWPTCAGAGPLAAAERDGVGSVGGRGPQPAEPPALTEWLHARMPTRGRWYAALAVGTRARVVVAALAAGVVYAPGSLPAGAAGARATRHRCGEYWRSACAAPPPKDADLPCRRWRHCQPALAAGAQSGQSAGHFQFLPCRRINSRSTWCRRLTRHARAGYGRPPPAPSAESRCVLRW